jgi:hypothetical protein
MESETYSSSDNAASATEEKATLKEMISLINQLKTLYATVKKVREKSAPLTGP